MKSSFEIQSFPFASSLLHIAAGGGATLLQPPFSKAELGRLDGRLLATFPIRCEADAHSHLWEMHPEADEVLFMVSGELAVDYTHSIYSGSVSLEAGKGIVMPQGVWHRLILRQPGLLLALTAPHGTVSSPNAGGLR